MKILSIIYMTLSRGNDNIQIMQLYTSQNIQHDRPICTGQYTNKVLVYMIVSRVNCR